MCKYSWRKNEPLLPWALLTVWNVNPPVKQGALLTQLMRNSLFKLQAGQLVVIWRKERNLAEKQLGAFSQVSRRQWGPMVVYATRLMDPLWGDKSRVREGSGSDSWRGMRGSAIWQSGEMGGGCWRWRYLTQGAASPDVGKFPYEGGSQVADDGRIKD